MKYMMMLRTDENFTEAGPPPKELFERMDKFIAESTKAGSLVWAGGLMHTSKGAKVSLSKNGKISVVDGPFTEAKEVIGGFFVLEVKDKPAVVAMTRRFLELHQKILGKDFLLECEVRQLDG